MFKRDFKRIVALLLALSAVALAACSLVEVIPERDNKRVVARVGSDDITKGELLYMYEINKSYFEITEDMETDNAYADYIKQCKDDILEYMIEEKVVEIRAREAGYLNYSEQDKLDASAVVDDSLKDYLDYYRSIYAPEDEEDDSVDVEALAQEALNAMLEESGQSRDEMIGEQLRISAVERYMNDQVADVVPTDEEVREEYNSKLESQKASYEEDITAFETDLYGGVTLCYKPDGYRYVKHILIPLPDDKEYAFKDTRASATSAETAMNGYADETTALKEQLDSTEDADLRKELETQIADLAEKSQEKADEYSLYTELADKEREDALKDITASATSVLDKVQAGEDFEALIEEYGEDPGMQNEMYSKNGYALSKSSSFMPEFLAAALKLTESDDVSGLVPTDYGYHIIKLMSIIKGGDVPFEDVKDALTTEVTDSKQSLRKSELREEWYSMAIITRYTNRF